MNRWKLFLLCTAITCFLSSFKQTANGESVECVNITKQLGLDYDLLKSHTIQYAIASKKVPKELYGAKATISIWRPKVETKDEFSISQIWITSGSYENHNLNSVEVGWQVSRVMYGDSEPRLFVYWTSDEYKHTGCYNLECPGFIQTNNDIVLGGMISPVSKFEGKQYELTISIWKDPKSGNWWLGLGPNNSLVGYWAKEIFASLSSADEVQWGGEIVNSQSSGRHTTTEMGSGNFPNKGFGESSYFRNLETVDYTNSFLPVQKVRTETTNSTIYNIRTMSRDDWGTCFFYGGSVLH
ncbi:unnamed protein product [Cochlearia groenlandica]